MNEGGSPLGEGGSPLGEGGSRLGEGGSPLGEGAWSPALDSDLPGFGAALCGELLRRCGAHGARLRVWRGHWQELGVAGAGLSVLGDLAERARAGGEPVHDPQGNVALPLGTGVLELVGPGDPGAAVALRPLLTLALGGALARERRRRRGRLEHALAQLMRRMGGSLDTGELLGATAETAARALGFGRAFVGIFAELGESSARTGRLFTYGFPEEADGGEERTLGVGPISFEKLVRRGEVIVYHRDRDLDSPWARGLSALGGQCAAVVPLAARGQPLGLLYVDSHDPAAHLNEDDTWLLLALGEQASLSIDNARLYAEQSRRREQAEALREAGQRLSQGLLGGQAGAGLLREGVRLGGAGAAALYRREGHALRPLLAQNLDSGFVLRARARPGSGVIGRALEHGRAEADLTRDPAALDRRARALMQAGRLPYRHAVALGLGQEHVLALLYAQAPSEDTLRLLDSFRPHAELALQGAERAREEGRREREAALLLGLSRLLAVYTPGALAGAMDAALALLLPALGAERGALGLRAAGEDLLAVRGLRLGAGDAERLQRRAGAHPGALPRRACVDGGALGLLVPLRTAGRVLGWLYADRVTPPPLDGAFGPTEPWPGEEGLGLARAAAAQLALTLGTAQLTVALAGQEARYRQLTEEAGDPILSLNAAGEVEYANPAAGALLGDGLPGRSFAGLLTAEGRARFGELWSQAHGGSMTGGSATGGSATGGSLTPRAEVRELETQAGALLEVRLSPVPQGALLLARDLTEARRLASEIAQRGEQAEAFKERTLQLRTVLGLMTQAQEEERRRLSRELHDDTAQALVAIARRLERLAREHPGAGPLLSIRDDVQRALGSVRRNARALRPSVLDDLGLLPALESLCAGAQTPTRLEVQGQDRRLGSLAELTVYRAVQEALSNVDQHAGAGSAAVRVAYGDDVQVHIHDDGVGLCPDALRERQREGHLGLLGLRERLELIGGWLDWDSAPGEGTTLRFGLPG